jgi:E3 ubiquitin-protein ligase UBR7
MEISKDTETFTAEEVLNNVNKEIVFFSKYEQNKELKCCTYDQGYITQEVYTCITCHKNTNELAGICSGCAFNCHKDHDLAHLYFKRNFKCDCGNSKFGMNVLYLKIRNSLLIRKRKRLLE